MLCKMEWWTLDCSKYTTGCKPIPSLSLMISFDTVYCLKLKWRKYSEFILKGNQNFT
jgi:hypothetical protein